MRDPGKENPSDPLVASMTVLGSGHSREVEASGSNDRAAPATAGDQVLGTDPMGNPIALRLDRLMRRRALIQAISDGGKSFLLRRLLEQLYGHVQAIVIDPEGQFHTLREKFDYLLAAPVNGDVLATPETARSLAFALRKIHVSCVVDLSDLSLPDQFRFVRIFLDALLAVRVEHPHPTIVVVDEAQLFAPQRGEPESRRAVVDLMSRGRKRRLCGILATSRLSLLDKNAASQAGNKFIGLTPMDIDRRRVAYDLGLNPKDQQALGQLESGEFYTCGPAISNQVVRLRVYGVQTTHEKDEGAITPAPPSLKIREVLSELNALMQEGEAARGEVQEHVQMNGKRGGGRGPEHGDEPVPSNDRPGRPAGQRPLPARSRAADLLRTELAKGPKAVADVLAEATGAGISHATLYRAKDDLRVQAFDEDGGRRTWALPGALEALPVSTEGDADASAVSSTEPSAVMVSVNQDGSGATGDRRHRIEVSVTISLAGG